MSNTYSFLNVQATITGPGGSFSIGNGSGTSEEGITVEMAGDKNTMTIGADGTGMHSLHADKSGTLTVRLLKTSPQNAKLMAMYDLQTADSRLHGQNVVTIVDTGSNDSTGCRGVAFKKKPTLTYAKEGQIMEWAFDAVAIDSILGTY
ncbi:DUF3277 family protein [Rhodanobacter glycinis]|uniref:DUF3277 family protein n=1 Tax=Rhodanobacter glycinis TaxID=582702 RepID=A0A5B9DZ81_9GAMM|nr:phage protein [Rhodanobacter glycinis]QEE24524.1 DUF3277 family protein [Rhodanobacter glycinis]